MPRLYPKKFVDKGTINFLPILLFNIEWYTKHNYYEYFQYQKEESKIEEYHMPQLLVIGITYNPNENTRQVP